MPDVRVTALARGPLGVAAAARLARAVLRAEGAGLQALSVTFVGPARMRTLNRTHLGKDRPTDVLAFAIGGPPPVAGDVYVCPAVAARDAARFGTTPRAETARLVVHGVLHVLGYDHPAGAERTRSPMWRRQERLLSRYGAR